MPEEDIAFFTAEIQRQAQQFVRTFNKLCVFNQCHAQVNFGEVIKGDGFLDWIVSQRASYRRGSGFYFFFRRFHQCFNLLHIDAVIQCLERIHFMAQQRLLDTIPGQFCIEECFCALGQFGSTGFR